MEGPPGANPKANRGDLATLDVDSGRTLTSLGLDGQPAEHVDRRLLECLDDSAYPDPRALQIEEKIRYQLSRPMVRHLPSSISAHHGNCTGVTHVAASTGLPEGEDRRMLQQPEFVG